MMSQAIESRRRDLGFARTVVVGLAWWALAAAILAPIGIGQAAAAVPGIFSSTETRKEGLKPFPKWTGALDKYFKEREKVSGGCEDPEFNRCHYREWAKLIDSVKGQNFINQLNEINKFMNRHKYIVDSVNWGVKDYWESPAEFFDRYGDCEDYSIAKYLTLITLGVDPNSMRIFIVMDMNLKVAHAILAVYTNDQVLILDNQLSIVVDSEKIKHYKPIFSVNETGWWKHKVVKTAKKKRKVRSSRSTRRSRRSQ